MKKTFKLGLNAYSGGTALNKNMVCFAKRHTFFFNENDNLAYSVEVNE